MADNKWDDLRVGLKVGQYELTEVLGEGGFGAVFEGVTDNNDSYAIKFSKKECVAFVNEEAVLSELRGSGIVPELYSVGSYRSYDYLVLEECVGSALDIVEMTGSGQFNAHVVQKILRQSVAALRKLHELSFLHQDLKAENVFISAPQGPQNVVRILLGDLGLVGRHNLGKRINGEIRPGANVYYASPSGQLGHTYSTLDDVLMLSYISWNLQNIPIDKFIGAQSLAYKIHLFEEPNSHLPDKLLWMVPFFASIHEAVIEDGLNYKLIEEGLEDMMRDTTGLEDLLMVGGDSILG